MKKIGRYEIKEKIGQGGMGVVFRAYDPPPVNRDVALKTLPELADRATLQLFYKECDLLKSITHPNVVEILDIGEFQEGGKKKPFFVMSLLQGQTLDRIIKDAPQRLTVERVLDIVSQACRGLQDAHDHGLIHRDIKPSNLFIIGDNAVKIIDFGVAHAIDSRSRSGSFSKGTLLYMSPEQVDNKPVTPQSDIFSLGVVCYEALTKRHPFKGATEEEIMEAIRRHNPPPAWQLNDSVSELVGRVVHKAMAKKSLNRYDNAKEFGEFLQRAQHNLPIPLFDPARIQPRIDRAKKAVENGDYQFAADIVSELEAGGNIDVQITDLRTDIERFERQRAIAQLLESAQTRFEEDEDPLALQKIHEVLQIDPGNVQALSLKSKIEARSSDRQVDQWMRLAKEHIDNHSYTHARDAVRQVLDIRPKESRAIQLLKEIDADEQDYLALRQEKSDLYKSAVNAWQNGDVSRALSHMEAVLALDRRAPEPSTSAPYQSFYDKVHSEHEALNARYAEARRYLTDNEFAKALEICETALKKHPGQPLFQALKSDIEFEHRQRLSSYIADVNRRLDAQSDLETKVGLLRDAVKQYPGEPHFDRLLRSMEEKRDLVRSIVIRAEQHEAGGEINEALSDYQMLANIYPSFPGLGFEIERLQKRRDQLVRDAAKAEWMRKIDRQRDAGNYSRAFELLAKADAEFPSDADLEGLRRVLEQGAMRAHQADQLLTDAQLLIGTGKVEAGLAMLVEAHRLDERSPAIGGALRDAFLDQARANLDIDWHTAEALVEQAIELDPQHPVAKSLRAQISDRRRDEAVTQCATLARQWQSERQLEKAETELKRVLAVYPGDPRLTVILDAVRKELGHSTSRKARRDDLEQLRKLRHDVEKADSGDLQEIAAQTKVLASRYVGEPNRHEIDTIAREIDRIYQNRRGKSDPKDRKPRRSWSALFRDKFVLGGIATVMLVVMAGVVTYAIRKFRSAPLPAAPVAIATLSVRVSPGGATLLIDGTSRNGSTPMQLNAGEHKIEASLAGYASETQTLSLEAGGNKDVSLALKPLDLALRLVMPDIENGTLWFDDEQIKFESGGYTRSIGGMDSHVVRIATSASKDANASEEAQITFAAAIASLPAVTDINVTMRQAVVVSSFGTTAHIASSVAGAQVAVDGVEKGTLTSTGLDVSALMPGDHELTVGAGKDLRRLSFTIGPAPALDAVVYSDRDVGSALVMASEGDVTVQVDGKEYSKKTDAKGQLRVPNLPSKSHTIRVHKDGFADLDVQTINVVKGQEVVVRFQLPPVQRLAHLDIQRAPPQLQVFLDDGQAPLGIVAANGTLARDVPPGSHALRLSLDGYQPKRLTKDFSAGQTVSLSAADLDLLRAQATLEVTTDGLEVTVTTRDRQQIGRFKGSSKLNLNPGTYTVEARDASGLNYSETLTLAAGDAKSINPRINTPGMDRFERPDQWTLNGTWFARKGGDFVLYGLRPVGRVIFTLKPGKKGGPFFRRTEQRLRWVLGFVDAKNYMLIEMDGKSLYRSEYVDGKRIDLPKIEHGISWDNNQFFNIVIDVTDKTLTHQFKLDKGDWKPLDKWDRGDQGAAASTRPFTDGKFGFYIPGNDSIEVSNFTFYLSSQR